MGDEITVCDCHTWPTVAEFHEYTLAVERQRDRYEAALREIVKVFHEHNDDCPCWYEIAKAALPPQDAG